MRPTTVAGVGGIAFGVLTAIALFLGNPPGGSYTVSEVTAFTARGHRASVFVAAYLMIIASAGLICLLAGLRRSLENHGNLRGFTGGVFSAVGLIAAAAYVFGAVINLSVPMIYAFSSGGDAFSVPVTTTYLVVEVGATLLLVVGGVLLGVCLLMLAFGSNAALPRWLRWVTGIAGVMGFASFVFFPWFGVLVWALVVGIWLLSSRSARALDTQAV